MTTRLKITPYHDRPYSVLYLLDCCQGADVAIHVISTAYGLSPRPWIEEFRRDLLSIIQRDSVDGKCQLPAFDIVMGRTEANKLMSIWRGSQDIMINTDDEA